MSMVSGGLAPGPAPAGPALFNSSAATLSKLAGVTEGKNCAERCRASTGPAPRCRELRLPRPERSTSASSIESPPTSTDGPPGPSPFAPGLGMPGSIAQVNVGLEQLPQPQMLAQRGRSEQPGVSHQPVIVEGHCRRRRGCAMMASKRCLRTGSNVRRGNRHSPRSGAPFRGYATLSEPGYSVDPGLDFRLT